MADHASRRKGIHAPKDAVRDGFRPGCGLAYPFDSCAMDASVYAGILQAERICQWTVAWLIPKAVGQG